MNSENYFKVLNGYGDFVDESIQAARTYGKVYGLTWVRHLDTLKDVIKLPNGEFGLSLEGEEVKKDGSKERHRLHISARWVYDPLFVDQVKMDEHLKKERAETRKLRESETN